MKPYFVVFIRDKESDLNFSLEGQFFTIRLLAKNAKDARGKAWKTVHGDPRHRWLVREGWYLWNTGETHEEWPPGIRRGEMLYLR